MRKKWLYFFIVLVAIVVVLYVLRYKQSQVFENRVPAGATKIVNINLRQIENHLLFDFLANPITYLTPRKRKDSIKKERFSLFKSVSIPRNILFYTNSEELKNNWFSTRVKVKDEGELSNYLLKEKFVQSTEGNVIIYSKANFILAIKNEQLIISIKVDKKADINPALISLFDTEDFLAEDTEILKPLVNNNSDISFTSSNETLQANFRDGIFELQGTLTSNLFVTNNNIMPDEEDVISISGKVNKDNTVFNKFWTDKKDKFNEITHLSLDSIVQKWNGKLNFNITSIEQKTDTIVSYEYDDDFNKVEIKSTQEKKIPVLGLILGQENPSSLSDYFYGKNAIQVIENDTVFTTIPIFKFLATDAKDNLELRVNQKRTTPNPSSSSKLKFYFNVKKYMETPLDIPLSKDQEELLKLVKATKLEWAKDNQFTLKINLLDESRNFLGQLIKQ
ncbi:hypothetical protein UMM65_17360 [Aureibaculum sp. 2210JD6-5]|uniref:hypothetical protein n=1 Tax=Aureibaculum sp. 2210JD6-5 TaxID=3103957 RepID=UPI002AACD6F0|nr:hypothetical protein [Aureibaculum sp. 2210JD6-5]MDY7397017.1 hypothetical protein [Aureibaculum sp. 2210JD6-5]